MADRLFDDAYLAALYDLWYPRPLRDDYDFYLPRIMAAGSVLDAGCGTGTLLADARARGHAGRLVGLDPAPGMLACARRHADIEWVLGDLASARWEGEFDLIVMTGHAFQAMVEDADLAAAVAAVRRALAPDGRFAFETRNPAVRAWERWRPENASTIAGPGGEAVTITTRVTAPFDGRTVSFTHSFTGDHPALPQVSGSTLRFLDEAGLEALLSAAGLTIVERYGDFDGGPPSAQSPEIVVIAGVA